LKTNACAVGPRRDFRGLARGPRILFGCSSDTIQTQTATAFSYPRRGSSVSILGFPAVTL